MEEPDVGMRRERRVEKRREMDKTAEEESNSKEIRRCHERTEEKIRNAAVRGKYEIYKDAVLLERGQRQ